MSKIGLGLAKKEVVKQFIKESIEPNAIEVSHYDSFTLYKLKNNSVRLWRDGGATFEDYRDGLKARLELKLKKLERNKVDGKFVPFPF